MTKQTSFLDYIPPQRKQAYFRIIEDPSFKNPNLHAIGMRLHFLEEHFPPNKIDAALKWLITHNVTGLRFLHWFQHQCHNSDLEMHARLLAIVDNGDVMQPVAGKTFKQ